MACPLIGGEDRRPSAAKRLAARDPQLIADQVATGDELRHWMLDLEPRVHLQEEELAGIGQQHLHRPGIDVAHRRRDRHRRVAHPRAQLGRDRGRRSLLHDLLVSSLRRAVALAEMHPGAVRIEQDLELDVSRALQVALQDQPIVGEGPMRLTPSGAQRLGELRRRRSPRACPCRHRRRWA